MCSLALAVGAVAVEAGALLYALPTVLRGVGVPALATMCERVLAAFLPGNRAAGWAAAVVALTIPLLALLGCRRARLTYRTVRVERGLGEHTQLGDFELVVLPTKTLLAVSVDGSPGQIVLSQGIVEALSADQLALVLRHEAAHLELGHQRTLQMATALDYGFVVWPLVRRSTAALRTALERWADEAAAGEHPDQRQLLRSALLGASGLSIGAEVAAFSAAQTVMERLDALAQEPPRPTLLTRGMLYLPGVVFLAALLVAVAAWSGEVRMLVSMAGRCPA